MLALVGNSGNSVAPHLHFHVISGPLPLAVFPDRRAEDPEGKEVEYDSVPDAVAVGPDGAYYVGKARVCRKAQDGELEVYARGFTNIIAFGLPLQCPVSDIWRAAERG